MQSLRGNAVDRILIITPAKCRCSFQIPITQIRKVKDQSDFTQDGSDQIRSKSFSHNVDEIRKRQRQYVAFYLPCFT